MTSQTSPTQTGITASAAITRLRPSGARRTRRTLAAVAALAAVSAGAPPIAVAEDLTIAPDLTRTYRADDGSALYTRAIGSKVVGLGENAAGTRAFVFDGTRSGVTIKGRWWDIAKGSRTEAGTLELTYADAGAKLQRSGGADLGPEAWQAKDADQMIWPEEREAGFQSTQSDDLDGMFQGDDDSRAYVRQSSTDVVWLAERFANSTSTRPMYATIGIAKRTQNGSMAGTFYDIPKGNMTLRRGTVSASVLASPRRFRPVLVDSGGLDLGRASSYSADYAVDLARFGQEIEQRLAPFVVGFSYAIAADDKVVRQDAGGSRRIPQPDNDLAAAIPYTSETYNEIASVSKVVTAVAVARSLKADGLTLDAKVDPYLPAQWARGPGMTTVTFRQLLAHGGLAHPGSICGTDPYACLKQAVALGMTAQPGYNNIHYTIMRVILPFLQDKQQMVDFFAAQPDTGKRNEFFSSVFQGAIRTTLTDGWAFGANFDYPDGVQAAYRYIWGTPPTGEISPDSADDDYLFAGSGGLKMNSIEGAAWLNRLENGEIIPLDMLQQIKDIGFGQTSNVNGPAAVGELYNKAGGAAGTGAHAMVFPGNVQVFITRNSTGNAAQTDDSFMLRDAWKAALINAS